MRQEEHAKTLAEMEKVQPEHGIISKKKAKYTPAQKTVMAQYCLDHGPARTVEQFMANFPNLAESTVRGWAVKLTTKRKKTASPVTPVLRLDERKRNGRGRCVDVKIDLMLWIIAARRAKCIPVNVQSIIAKSRTLLKQHQPEALKTDEPGNTGWLRITRKWVYRFLRGHNLSFRRATTAARISMSYAAQEAQREICHVPSARAQYSHMLSSICGW